MKYAVEICGWEEKRNLGKIMLDYVRWIFNIEFCILICDNERISYEQIKDRLGKAVRYERRIKKRREDDLLWCC